MRLRHFTICCSKNFDCCSKWLEYVVINKSNLCSSPVCNMQRVLKGSDNIQRNSSNALMIKKNI